MCCKKILTSSRCTNRVEHGTEPMVGAGSRLGMETHANCIRVRRASLSLSRPAQPTERTLPFLPYKLSLTGRAPDAADAGRLGDAARDTRASAASAVGFRRSRWLFRVAAVASITFVASRWFEKKSPERSWRQVASWPRQKILDARATLGRLVFRVFVINRHFDRSTALASRVGIGTNRARAFLAAAREAEPRPAAASPPILHLFEHQ